MKIRFANRLLALFLTLCTLVGLLPAVSVLGVRAEESTKTETRAVADETNAALNRLISAYGSFTIPVNKEVKNYSSLDGVFFIRESGAGRTINFANGSSEHKDRLTANSSSEKAAGNYNHLGSLPVTAANDGSFTKINGNAINNLDYAVEIKKYEGKKIIWDTTTVYTDTSTGKTYKGWAKYIEWEYNRSNSWSGDKKFGEYVGINGLPKTSDPVYSIKSLHPKRATAPYLATNNGSGSMKYASETFPWFLKVYSTNASAKIYKVDPTGGSQVTYWLGFDLKNSNYVSGHTLSQIVREDRNKRAADLAKFAGCNDQKFKFQYWDFFQVSPAPLELYRALEKAKSYVDGKNANGAYPEETYLGFLNFTETALTLYNSKRTVWSTDKNHADRIHMDTVAKALYDYMALLEIEAKPGSYMDIPMEVLDFRADGLMFEFLNGANAYSLSSAAPSVGPITFPGTLDAGENGVKFVEGLIEEKLIDGHIVYTKEVVSYIAHAMYMQHMTFSDPAAIVSGYIGDFGSDDFDTYYNSVFMSMIDPNTGNRASSGTSVRPSNHYFQTLGDWDGTLSKTTGTMAGKNGGILRFDQVTTYFDLAYYILNNIWRETPTDDIVQTVSKDGKTFQLPYNMKINELHTMRLLKDSSGNYVFSSDKANGRNLEKGIIYNYNLTTPSGSTVPTLNAAAELGFEHPDMLGDNSTGHKEDPAANYYGRRNYHVMYHMRSTFVYYSEKDLQFSFVGDDDVYFFINGERVCEIGGTHSPADSAVSLNGAIAQKLGLQDGDICTFDMYLAERHISGINLNLKTNIDMMPVGIATDKVQYQYTQPGVIGEEIREGGVVADNTKVGYGFKLLNRCDHGAVDLTFMDDNLNVHLTPDTLSLGGKADVEDLILIYRTYDPHSNEIYSGEPVAQSYDSFKSRLIAAVEDMSTIVPMGEGAYKLTGLTEAQIKELLQIGLPASVQISVYGFCQTVSSSVGGYTNVVNTTCRPIAYRQADGSFAYEAPLSGFATRNLNVQTMNTVTAEPLQIVIDYGKPVVFTVAEILECVTYDPMDVQVSFKGFLKTGKHGAIAFRDPTELFLHEENGELPTDNGIYDRSLDTVRFTPIGMLEEIDRIYAMVRVDDVYLGSGWYLTVAVEIIPATLMYYEAEDLATAGELSFMEKWTEEAESDASEPGADETEPPDTEEEEGEPEEPPTDETEPEESVAPETPSEDDGVRTNAQITYVHDTEDREHPVSTYAPTNDRDVLFFGFDDPVLNKDRYINTQTPTVYGNVNFDEVVNWWSPGYGSISGINDGAIYFTTNNQDNPWGYVATGKADSSALTTANKADFPLQYIPSDDDWCEIRLKVDKTAVQDGTGMHLRIEFFPFHHDASLPHAAVSTKLFPEGALNNGWFVLKFPLTTVENTENPCSIKYSELSIVRRINFLIRGLDKSETFTSAIDYIYIGPEEHCPSNQKMDYLYFGFDNTDKDRYRYTNPIYGYTYNFDKAPSSSGDDWSYNSSRTTGFKVTDGALEVTCGATGNVTTNSPWLQTGVLDMTKNLNYPTSRAEVAWVRLKLSDLTTFVDPIYDLEYAVARLAFVLNDDPTMETSSCWVDFPLSEEQLNGSDYMTLSADIASLLADYEAKRITAVRLTLINGAAMAGKTGTFRIDEIYVGPRVAQDTDAYIAPTKTDIPTAPSKEWNTPTFDTDVLYFGFGNTATDTDRYNINSVYNKNFDTAGSWFGVSGGTLSISDGAMQFAGGSGDNSWTQFSTGTGNADLTGLNFQPGADDWFEVRIKVNDLTALNDRTKIDFDLELYKDGTYRYKISNPKPIVVESGEMRTDTYYTITFQMPENSGGWANCIPYKDIGTVKRLVFLPTGLKPKNTFKCSVDYIYIGPAEKLPSKLSSNDRLYFGFDNDRAAQHKYGSTVYGGDNFDTPGKWRYATHRSTAPTIANGMMTATVIQEGHPWFETARNGTSGGYYMNYVPTNAEIVRVRVKFHNIEMANNAEYSAMAVSFGDGVAVENTLEPIKYTTVTQVPDSHIATDDKWFTYTVELGDKLKNVPRVTGMRIRFHDIISSDGTGTVSFDYIYVGPRIDAPPEEYRRDEDYTYGWDSSYVKDSVLSDNEALYLEGRGVPVTNEDYSVNYEASSAYSEVFFSFTGTGFDLIGRTGKNQGTLRAAVYKKVADIDGTRDVFVKSITVNAKGELELNQIPVVSVQGLDHDTYYVKIWFNDKVTPPQIPGLDLSYLARGNEFHIDAIRIYDPMDVEAEELTVDEQVALDVYETDKEAYNYIKEVRNILLSKENFDDLSGTLDGAIFVDMETTPPDIIIRETDAEGETTGETTVVKPEDVEVTDHITAKVQTYNKVGPKNEVYLAPGQAVAFLLAVDTLQPIVSLDIGAKNILAESNSELSVGFVTGTDTVEGKVCFPITTATAQYYAVNTESIRYLTSGSTQEIYLVIYNSTEGDGEENVISITDIKVAYEGDPDMTPPADKPADPEIKRGRWQESAPVRFLVDKNATAAAVAFVRATMDDTTEEPPVEDTPTEDEKPIVAEGIRILHSLNLASDISVNYAVAKTELEGYENITLVVTRPVYEGNEYRGTQTVTLMPRDQDGFLYFTLDGMTAINMNDTVEAVLTMTKDGKAYTTQTDTYSVARYAYAQLGKAYIEAELKTLCADLLRYGAQAQSYKGYRTDSLADSAMTEEYKGYLTDLETVTFDSVNTTTGNVEGSAVRWAGKTLLLDSKVTIRYVVDLTNYTGALSDLSLVVSYRDPDGTEQTVTLRDPVLYNEDLHYYSFSFDGLLAAELRQPISATVYVGMEPVTGTLQYSASTYGANKTGPLGELCKCLMAYSDSARAYFTK